MRTWVLVLLLASVVADQVSVTVRPFGVSGEELLRDLKKWNGSVVWVYSTASMDVNCVRADGYVGECPAYEREGVAREATAFATGCAVGTTLGLVVEAYLTGFSRYSLFSYAKCLIPYTEVVGIKTGYWGPGAAGLLRWIYYTVRVPQRARMTRYPERVRRTASSAAVGVTEFLGFVGGIASVQMAGVEKEYWVELGGSAVKVDKKVEVRPGLIEVSVGEDRITVDVVESPGKILRDRIVAGVRALVG